MQPGRPTWNHDLASKIEDLQRQLEQRDLEISRLREEKARLVAMAAHDLRHPVSALLTYAELLLESETPLAADDRILVLEMRRCGEFMRELLDDVFDVASLDSVPFEWELAPVDDLVRESVDLLRPLAVRKRIQIRITSESGIPLVLVDKARMLQAYTNVVNNAVKFSPVESTIDIRVVHNTVGISVCVKDNGPGIPADEIGRIFQPFAKTRNRAAAKEPGTGLGLAICKRILERHGGRIWVESSGQGSAFFIVLPLPTERDPAASQTRGDS